MTERTDEARERKRAAQLHNKRLDLIAGWLDRLSTLVVGAAFVVPAISSGFQELGELGSWVWIVGGMGLHAIAQIVLGNRKLED